MAPAGLSLSRYRRITAVALWSLVAIVVTGAAVRLTGSGLGCSDWPTCEENQLVPDAELHGWVEFGNRLITGVVAAAVIVAVLAARRLAEPRRDLEWWAWGLVAGVIAQVVLGAVTVFSHLSPPIVMGHFLLSMVLVWNAVVLHHKAAHPRGPTRRRHGLATAVAGWSAVVVFTGTIVTAAGPHGGDEDVERLDVALPDAARVHGIAVVVLIALTLVLRSRPGGNDPPPSRHLDLFLATLGAQAAIGYIQYFTGVPVLLVGVHIAGATAVWIQAVGLTLRAPPDGADATAPLRRTDLPRTMSR